MDNSDALGTIGEFRTAKEIVDTYNRFLTTSLYEVLTFSDEEPPSTHNNYLGVDISSGINLSCLLMLQKSWKPKEIIAPERDYPLFYMVQFFISKSVNTYKLLNEFKDAVIVLDYIKYVAQYNPRSWDNPNEYMPLSLWSLYP
jgi:hypothetical protein